VNGVYKLVADRSGDHWRGVRKLSAGKQTLPGAKQVWRRTEDGEMRGDLIAPEGERCDGEGLLVALMRDGEPAGEEPLEALRERAVANLAALPAALRDPEAPAGTEPYPVAFTPSLAVG